jgi:hypothetical protein
MKLLAFSGVSHTKTKEKEEGARTQRPGREGTSGTASEKEKKTMSLSNDLRTSAEWAAAAT